MEDVGHSALLKFLVSGDTKMTKTSNIKSEVPGEQKLREGGPSVDNEKLTLDANDKAQTSLQEASTSDVAAPEDFTLEPVITVTKHESTFTKGEMKLQKVTVTEDISQTSAETRTSEAINRRLPHEIQTKIPSPTNASKRDEPSINTTEKENIEAKRGKTKIPTSRFRQAVDQVKKEQKETRKTETVIESASQSTTRKSSIPRLKDNKIAQLTTKDVKISKDEERSTVADEDEFDKIFREINEKGTLEVSISNEECVSQVESNFDEIIHAYEEDVQEKVQLAGSDRIRQSRIPTLKRKSEHDIERPLNRERYTIKKSLSVDINRDDTSDVQTEYETENLATEEIQGYAETSNEIITFRSETSYSNEYNTKKRQGITCNENVYDRILITDETFENAEERYRLSKYKQEPIDVDITEAVPIIDEPEDTIDPSEITESYDDINVTAETQLTKISSEQVRFDKQIVSKIYKIDFTENTFELADSETTEVSNGHTQATTKEEAIKENITSYISKDSSISKFVDHRKTQDAVEDFKASRFNTISNETREYRDEQNATVSYTIESERRFVKTSEELKGQSEVLTKVGTKHSIETLRSKTDHHEDKIQDKATTNVTESITIEPLKEIKNAEKNNQNNTTYNAKETRETAVNVNKDIISESTVKINGTEETATYSSYKYSHKNTGSSAVESGINDKKDGENNTNNTTGSMYIRSAKEKRETGYASGSLITREDNKETENTTNTESNTIRKETEIITKGQKDIVNSSSTLVRNISKELEKHTQSNETNLVITQDVKEINPKTSWVLKAKSKDITDTTTNAVDLTQSTNETKITSNVATNEAEVYERKITKNQTESQSTFKSISNSNEAVTEKCPKPERSENNHDAETYKIYSDVFSKLSTTRVPTKLDTKTDYNQRLEFSTKSNTDTSDTLTVQENSSNSEENSVLSGKVSRIINLITSIDATKTEDKELLEKDVPKKKSILSKIALFERDEPYEKIPKPKASQPEPKPLRGLAALRQTSRELRKPKIVDEIYKEYSERETVQRNTKSLSEKDEEEITIEIKDVKNNAEVNRFDSAFKAKLYDNKTTNNETRDIPKTEYFNTQKDIEVKDIGEEGNQEEITIEIKDVRNETNVPLSNSTFKSKYEYNSYKYDILKRAKSEGFHTQEERRTKEKNVKESVASNSSTSDLPHGINESKTKEDNLLNTDENLTINYESISKISNNTSSTSSNISNEASNSFRRTISSSTNLVVDTTSIEIDNPKMSDRWKVNEIDKNKKKLDIDVTRNEESKEMSNEKMTKRMRRRDPILQRAISVVEDDLNDVMKGKVKGLISRINSMEQMELTRKRNQEKNRPWASVSERIALFEEKASKAKAEKSIEGRSWRSRTVETAPKEMDEETCMKRIGELKEAKKTYGFTNTNYMELRDGTKMPVIALGTALLDKRLVRQVVETAIDLGYRAIDTAFIYGNEKEIGEGINAKINDGTVKREELFITSKLWSTFHRRDLVERACRSSLETMGLTYFDLYLIHNPMSLKEGGDPIPKIANVLQFSEHDFMDAWYGIEDLVTKGLVKSAGLSNFNSEQVHRVTEKGRLKPVVNQVECHPYLSQDRLAGFCDAYGMKLVCFGSLGSKGTPKTLRSSLPPAIEDPLVQVMAAGLGVSPAQLLLAFQVKKGRGVVAKASSASHLHENLAAQRLPLATGQLTALAALDRHKRTYTFEGMGETHKNYPFNIAF